MSDDENCNVANDKAGVIADFFLLRAHWRSRIDKGINPCKLQGLLYYSYVWWLILKKQKLFCAPIKASPHGPIIPSQHARFEQFRDEPINTDGLTFAYRALSAPIKQYLRNIWLIYGEYKYSHLLTKCKKEEPWQLAFSDKDHENIITDQSIENFYSIKQLFLILPKNMIIAETEQGYELYDLNQETIKAINTPKNKYKEYSLG